MKTCAAVVLACCVFWLPLSAAADIYAYDDQAGVRHYTNIPDTGDQRFNLVLLTPSEASVAASAGKVSAWNAKRSGYASAIEEAGRLYQVDAVLLHAVVAAESAYDPFAVSRKGAMGLMQLMPSTARRYGVSDPFDPAQNLRGGAQYLRDLLVMFNRDLGLALAAYNAGENAVVRYGHRIPPYPETLAYVPRVLKFYRTFQAGS
jgi:soluble lytic murein transglycosylase-like protein